MMDLSNKKLNRIPISIYFLIGFIAFCFRFYFNFSQDLIPGVNGGYYPLQVRSILNTGALGFADMPFLFYLDAALIKVASLFGLIISDNLTMFVVKIIDCISIPLLLLPLYKIVSLSQPVTSKLFILSISAFCVLSFSPLVLTSDLQKNALAITFLFGFVAYLISYQYDKKIFKIILALLFLIITGLTHFGTFIFALFFLGLSVVFTFKRKSIIPLTMLIIFGLGIVALFDISRFNRLLTIGALIFEKPALINEVLKPPDILIILISLTFAITGIIILIKNYAKLLIYQKAIMFSSIICLILLSFPMIDGDYLKRLSLFLFIPQTLLIIQMVSVINKKQLQILSIFLLIITLLSVVAVVGHPKEAVLNDITYNDLKTLKSVITKDDSTIVIARHGLEWWTAWALHTNVGQDKAFNVYIPEKYKTVIFLTQISGFSPDYRLNPFREPQVPCNSKIIFTSVYFKAFTLNKTKLNK